MVVALRVEFELYGVHDQSCQHVERGGALRFVEGFQHQCAGIGDLQECQVQLHGCSPRYDGGAERRRWSVHEASRIGLRGSGSVADAHRPRCFALNWSRQPGRIVDSRRGEPEAAAADPADELILRLAETVLQKDAPYG